MKKTFEGMPIHLAIKVSWLPQKDNGDGTVSNYFPIMPIIGATAFSGSVQGAN